jgi:hypothetical protein
MYNYIFSSLIWNEVILNNNKKLLVVYSVISEGNISRNFLTLIQDLYKKTLPIYVEHRTIELCV